MNTANDRVIAAVRALAKKRPFISDILSRLRPVESSECPTAAVDKWLRVYYNPEFVERLTQDQLQGLVYHETLHIFLAHPRRGEPMQDRATANISMDCEIHEKMRREDIPIPRPDGFKPCIAPEIGLPEDLSAEEYYEALRKRGQKPSQDGDGLPVPGNGARADEKSGAGGDGDQDADDDDNEPKTKVSPGQGEDQDEEAGGAAGSSDQDEDGDQDADSGSGDGDDGDSDDESGAPPAPGDSSATGGSAEWELPPDDPNEPGVEPSAVDAAVQKALREASEGRGNAPGWARDYAGAVLRARVPWRVLLSRYIREACTRKAGASDYSWARPNGCIPKPFIAPGVVGGHPRVGVILDASGSMMGGLYDQAVAEVEGICKALEADVHVAVCDTRVTALKRVRGRIELPKPTFGGTDLRAGFEALLRVRPRIGVLVVLTDCDTPWPATRPAVPVVVAKIGNYDRRAPEWARVVEVQTRYSLIRTGTRATNAMLRSR